MDDFLESSFSEVDFLEMDEMLQSTISDDVTMLPPFPDAPFPLDPNLNFPLPIKDECMTPQHIPGPMLEDLRSQTQINNVYSEPIANGNEILKSMLNNPITDPRQNIATTSNEDDFQFWFEYRDFQFNANDNAPPESDMNLNFNDIVPFQHDQLFVEPDIPQYNKIPDSTINMPVIKQMPVSNFKEIKKRKPSQPRIPKYVTKFNIHDTVYKCVFSCKHCGRIFTSITASQNHKCGRTKKKVKPTQSAQTLPQNIIA